MAALTRLISTTGKLTNLLEWLELLTTHYLVIGSSMNDLMRFSESKREGERE